VPEGVAWQSTLATYARGCTIASGGYHGGVDAQLPPPVQIGQRIDARLKELGRTASWLADRASIERSTVTRILRHERHPTARTLQSIAAVLELTVVQLVDGTDAADQVEEAPDVISRDYYNQAVREVIEYERKAVDLTSRLREMLAELKQERERRQAAEDKLASTERERDDARDAASRYADALDLAITDITLLRTRVDKLVADVKEGKWTSRIIAGLASIAAAASVATYLTRASERAKPQKKTQKTQETQRPQEAQAQETQAQETQVQETQVPQEAQEHA
jgi:transcriptional regulator with XRE-family HTH domain